MIEPIFGPPVAEVVRRAGLVPGGGAAFQVRSPAQASSHLLADVSGVGLAGMIALQETEGDAIRDRDAKRRGSDLLAALRALQLRLLGGPDGVGGLDLAALAQAIPDAADPALGALVASIALRARIELAKRGISSQR